MRSRSARGKTSSRARERSARWTMDVLTAESAAGRTDGVLGHHVTGVPRWFAYFGRVGILSVTASLATGLSRGRERLRPPRSHGSRMARPALLCKKPYTISPKSALSAPRVLVEILVKQL